MIANPNFEFMKGVVTKSHTDITIKMGTTFCLYNFFYFCAFFLFKIFEGSEKYKKGRESILEKIIFLYWFVVRGLLRACHF